MATSVGLRSRARVVGALVAITGVGILHGTADGLLADGVPLTALRLGTMMLMLSACVVLVGLILHDMGRSGWGMPVVQLGAVGVVLAVLPLLVAAVVALRADTQLAPALFLCGLVASLAVFLMALVGQTKAEVDRELRLARLGRPPPGAGR